MMTPDVRATVRALATQARDAAGEHPTAEMLLRYHGGELGEEQCREVRSHLAVCPRCTRAVLDMASFPRLESLAGGREPSEIELARRWRRFRGRLPRRRSPLESVRFLQAVAAVLLVAVVGLSAALWTRSPETALRLVFVDLVAQGESGVRGPGETVVLPAAAAGVYLFLASADARPFAAYELEIFREAAGGEGTVAVSTAAPRRTPEGAFTLALRRELLAGGRYRLELFGVEGEHRLPLGTYRLRLEVE